MKTRTALISLLWKHDILEAAACTAEENAAFAARLKAGQGLPEEVYEIGRSKQFVRFSPEQLSGEEIDRLIALRQLETLQSIRGMVLFFVVLAIIGLILGFFGLMT